MLERRADTLLMGIGAGALCVVPRAFPVWLNKSVADGPTRIGGTAVCRRRRSLHVPAL